MVVTAAPFTMVVYIVNGAAVVNGAVLAAAFTPFT